MGLYTGPWGMVGLRRRGLVRMYLPESVWQDREEFSDVICTVLCFSCSFPTSIYLLEAWRALFPAGNVLTVYLPSVFSSTLTSLSFLPALCVDCYQVSLSITTTKSKYAELFQERSVS